MGLGACATAIAGCSSQNPERRPPDRGSHDNQPEIGTPVESLSSASTSTLPPEFNELLDIGTSHIHAVDVEAFIQSSVGGAIQSRIDSMPPLSDPQDVIYSGVSSILEAYGLNSVYYVFGVFDAVAAGDQFITSVEYPFLNEVRFQSVDMDNDGDAGVIETIATVDEYLVLGGNFDLEFIEALDENDRLGEKEGFSHFRAARDQVVNVEFLGTESQLILPINETAPVSLIARGEVVNPLSGRSNITSLLEYSAGDISTVVHRDGERIVSDGDYLGIDRIEVAQFESEAEEARVMVAGLSEDPDGIKASMGMDFSDDVSDSFADDIARVIVDDVADADIFAGDEIVAMEKML